MIAVLPEDENLWERMRRPFQFFMGWGILAAVPGRLPTSRACTSTGCFSSATRRYSPALWLLLTILNGLMIFAMSILAATRPFQWVRSLPARRKLKWVLWGTVAGVGPYILFYYIPHHMLAIYGDQAIKIALSVTFPFFILVPLATAGVVIRYPLLRHRLPGPQDHHLLPHHAGAVGGFLPGGDRRGILADARGRHRAALLLGHPAADDPVFLAAADADPAAGGAALPAVRLRPAGDAGEALLATVRHHLPGRCHGGGGPVHHPADVRRSASCSCSRTAPAGSPPATR